MTILHALLLAIVEGLTEFLPVSSTGHLILTAYVLKLPDTEFLKSFEVIIQLGAIVAIVVLYWRTLLQNRAVWWRVLAAFLPTGILGVIFYKFIKTYLLGNESITVLMLFLGGIALIVLEYLHKEKESHTAAIEDMPIRTAFFIGLFQSISMVPGVSRAAATIIGGLFLGTKRKVAVEFSFLLAVPTMMAASGLDLVESGFAFSNHEYTMLATGFIGSFIVALLAVKLFVRFVQNHSFMVFGVYRIILAIFYWTLILR